MLCLVVVMTNFVGLARILPPTASPPWLVRVMLYSFMFNVIAMVEQVTVSFGLNANKWLTKEREGIRKSMPWKKALVFSKDKVVSLFLVKGGGGGEECAHDILGEKLRMVFARVGHNRLSMHWLFV